MSTYSISICGEISKILCGNPRLPGLELKLRVIYEHDNLEFSQDMEVIVTPQNTYIVAVLGTDIE